jgi:choline dehydrogenase
MVVPRGTVRGRTSAINGQIFLRAAQEDFEEWAAAGIAGWTFQDILPFYRKSETDQNFKDALIHGHSGLARVVQPTMDEWEPEQQAFVQACPDFGFPYDADMNRPDNTGIGAF